MVNIGRSNLTFWTVSTPAPSCRWARNNPSQRCAKRSQNSRSFLSCASAASFLHCWTWSWKKSDVSSIAITTTKAPLTGASTNKKRSGPVFVPKEKAAPSGRPSSRLAIRGPARALPAIADRCRSTASRFLANQARPGAHRRGHLGPQTPGSGCPWQGDCLRLCRLPSINQTSLWLGAWTPTLHTRTARSAACRCGSGAHLQTTVWVPSFPALIATGATSFARRF